MSGTGTGRTPHSDPEWARNVEQRLRSLEQASTQRVGGDWTILQRDERLLAMNSQDGSTVALDGQVLIEDDFSPAGRGFVVRSELINGLTGGGTGQQGRGALANIIADLRALLGHPSGLGTGYPSAERAGGNIVEFIGDLIDKLFQGAQGEGSPSGMRTAADVANALAGHRLSILSNTAIAEAAALAIANAAYSVAAFHAIDPTLNGTFDVTTITGNTPTTINVTQEASVLGYIRIPTTTRKATVAWQGYGTTNIDRLRLNIYKVNTSNGTNSPIGTVSASPFVSNVAPGGQIPWVYVPIDVIDVAQGECYGAEIVVEGTGTHTMVGLPDYWLGPNQNVFPSQLAATRTAQRPIFESLTAGLNISTNTVNPVGSWSHIAAEDATVIVVVTTHISSGLYTDFDRQVDYDGIGMQSLGAVNHSNSSNGWTEYFVLERAPAVVGAALIELSISGAGTFRSVIAESISYQGVGSVGPLQITQGSTTGLNSGVFVSDPTHLILQSFAGESVIGAAYTLTRTDASTPRYADTAVNGSNSQAVTLAEQIGASSVQFSATANKSSPWSSAGVALAGIVPPATEITAPTYSRHVPWIALSSQTDATLGTYAPERTPFLIHNVDDYTPPVWCTELDCVAVGAGGSGQGEVGLNMGQGGEAGEWVGVTLHAGDDFIPGETVFTVIPGEKGAAIIGYFSRGNDGDPTLIEWVDPQGVDRVITAPGGEGGDSQTLFRYTGQTAGQFVFNSETYYGGRVAAAGAGGHEPGGGGGGAVIFQPFSGAGADGAVWMTARQVGTWTPPPDDTIFPFTFPSDFL